MYISSREWRTPEKSTTSRGRGCGWSDFHGGSGSFLRENRALFLQCRAFQIHRCKRGSAMRFSCEDCRQMRKNTKEKQTKVCILHQSQSTSLSFEPFAQTPAALCNTHDFEVNLEFEDRRRASPCGAPPFFMQRKPRGRTAAG